MAKKENEEEIEMVLISSKTKEALKTTGLNVGGDALSGLNVKVHQLIADAQARCEANGRKTVRASDF